MCLSEKIRYNVAVSRESLVLILGLVVFFAPSLGIPPEWKGYILSGSGILLLIVGYLLRRAAYMRKTDKGNGERGNDDSFSESKPTYTVDEDPQQV